MTVARSSVVFMAAQVALIATGLASSIVISRWLGPEGRGVVALVNVMATTATALATFGFGTAYTYLAGRKRYPRDQLVGSILVTALILGAFSSGLLLAFSNLLLRSVLRGMTTPEYVVTVASIPFIYFSFLVVSFQVGAGRAERAAIMQLGAGAFTALLVIASIVLGHAGVSGVIVATAVGAIFAAVFYFWVVVRADGLTLRGIRGVGRTAAAYAAKTYLGTLSGQFWLRADVLILNFYTGSAAVGQYSLATGVAEQVWIVDSSVSQVILHDVIGSSAGEAARLVARTTRNIVFVSGSLCLGLAIVAPWLIPWLFGSAFKPAVVPLWLLLPGVLGLAAARPISSYFYGQMGKPQITSGVSLLTAIVGVAAYFALVPPFGASGAAIGSSIAYLLPLAVYVPAFKRLSGIGPREWLVVNRQDLGTYVELCRSGLRRLRAAGKSRLK